MSNDVQDKGLREDAQKVLDQANEALTLWDRINALLTRIGLISSSMPLRMPAMHALAWGSTGLIAWLYSEQLGVLLAKINALSIFALLGYFLDRRAFPYARPSDTPADPEVNERRIMRRAAIIIGTMVAGALML